MDYVVNIPTQTSNQVRITLSTGQSTIIVGANGSGKTRLGVHFEGAIPAAKTQRIAAQKSLVFMDTLPPMNYENAKKALQFGNENSVEAHKQGHRWGGRPATHLLNDFHVLLQALHAERNHAATEFLNAHRIDPSITSPITALERLKATWDTLLPHRRLLIDSSKVLVKVAGAETNQAYAASEMSDGERAIFYFLGQAILAPTDGIIIIDEPEAHIHRAILDSLWNAIEKLRPDCGFVYITHDFDFAATHRAFQKFFVTSFKPNAWEIAAIPEDTGIPERLVVELVGTRRPVIFLEGERGSVDLTLYESLYPQFLLLPIGSCDAVIHTVSSYNNSAALHRMRARGIVDNDGRELSDIEHLAARDIFVLQVSEIENLFLLPSVFPSLASAFHCTDIENLTAQLKVEILTQARRHIDAVSMRYMARQLDRLLKKVESSSADIASFEATYRTEVGAINPAQIFDSFKSALEAAISNEDIQKVLTFYDNKGLLVFASRLIGLRDHRQLLEKLPRILDMEIGAQLKAALMSVTPNISLT